MEGEKKKLFDCETNLNRNMHVCGATATAMLASWIEGGVGSPTSSCQLPVTPCRPNQRDRGRHGARGAPDFLFPSFQPSISWYAETLFLPPFSLHPRLFRLHVGKCKYVPPLHLHRVRMRSQDSVRRSKSKSNCCRKQDSNTITVMHHLRYDTTGSTY